MASLDLRRKEVNRQSPESTVTLPRVSFERAFGISLLVVGLAALAFMVMLNRLDGPAGLMICSAIIVGLGINGLLQLGQARASMVIATLGLTFVIIATRFLMIAPQDIWRLSILSFPLIVIAAFSLSPKYGWGLAAINVIAITIDALLRTQAIGMPPANLITDASMLALIYVFGAIAGHGGAHMFDNVLAEVRASRHTIATRNQLLERQMRERDALETRQAEITKDMRAVLSAANEMLACANADDVWRKAIELAQHRLGVERCSVFVFTDDPTRMRGTYGIDTLGRLRSEKDSTVIVADQKWSSVFGSQNIERPAWILIEDEENKRNEFGEREGPAWVAATMIRSHSGAWLGVMYNDTLLSNRPFDPAKQDMLAVYCSLVAGIVRQKQLEAEVREHASVNATVAERSRLARELHDSVSQALFGIVLGSRTAILQNISSEAQMPLEYVLSLAESAMVDIRALIFELRPESLAQEGLIPALRKQLEPLMQRHKIALNIVSAEEPPLSLESREAFYRALIEAAQNTIKHARATEIKITFTHTPGDKMVCAVIDDNGVGFNANQAFEGHYGLINMKERMQRLNGSCEIISAVGVGTSVSLALPALM